MGKHHFVSLAPDQESIDCLHELRTDLGNFPAPVNPIVTAILAGDVVVKTVGETECDFAHGFPSKTSFEVLSQVVGFSSLPEPGNDFCYAYRLFLFAGRHRV